MAETGLRIGEVVKLTGLHEQTLRRLEKRGIISAMRVPIKGKQKVGDRLYPASVVPLLLAHYSRPGVDVQPSATMELINSQRSPIKMQIDEVLERSLSLPPEQLAQLVEQLRRDDLARAVRRTGEAGEAAQAAAPALAEGYLAPEREPLRVLQGGRSA